MASISTETDPIIEGIMNFSLKPYAEVNNISLKELVFRLYEYHQGVLMEELDTISNIPESESKSKSIIINNESCEPKPKKRGRPPGSKNKSNKTEPNGTTGKGPGRPRNN
tara:strand:+ start:659 stop:988 length:330 start_codon:yes stop_codon:yes gene_type:complete